jgi:hypothetical protein
MTLGSSKDSQRFWTPIYFVTKGPLVTGLLKGGQQS